MIQDLGLPKRLRLQLKWLALGAGGRYNLVLVVVPLMPLLHFCVFIDRGFHFDVFVVKCPAKKKTTKSLTTRIDFFDSVERCDRHGTLRSTFNSGNLICEWVVFIIWKAQIKYHLHKARRLAAFHCNLTGR